ncbi:MAG TPA: gluconeogenesis factor YvcK family protein [Candidatus Pristimantibacillus sp.]|nr:gluconeogenesis factor YvcK family protein [Candidatus Pristimantibacillus sp.]
MNPKIVVIGGGTGTFEMLSGLKNHTRRLTALVGMADDGGSTGILRDEYGVLPPGDVRKALVALARAPEMRELFNFRYKEGSLAGHSFGNIFLSTVEQISSNFTDAVDLAGSLLNIAGRVIPATLENVTLVLDDGSQVIRGESQLDKGIQFAAPRPKVWLEPDAKLTPQGRQAILEANLVVIAPGSLYGSLAAALVVDGMAEALAATKAPKVFICNLVNEHGQTDGFMVHDLAAEIERFLDGKAKLDYVLYNTLKPREDLLKKYFTAEHRTWVEYDEKILAKQTYKAIGGPFVHDDPDQPITFIRHDAGQVSRTLLEIYARQRATM